MQEGTVWLGLDVHKATVAVAYATASGGPPESLGIINNEPAAVRKMVNRFIDRYQKVQAAYEAGPTGYGIYRQLTQMGVDCLVVAPSRIPKRPGDRVKTDRRDALKLARLLRSGDLEGIWVPDEEHEALRNLVRARADAQQDLHRDRRRLNCLLLRLGYQSPPGSRTASQRYDRWLDTLEFEQLGDRLTFNDYRCSVRSNAERVSRLDSALNEYARLGKHSPTIAALQAFRGVGVLTATTLVAEIGDIRRFSSPRQLMAYIGIVPSEHSSGPHQRRGQITRAGNHLLRHVMVEAAHHSRRPPRMAPGLKKRQEGQPQALIDLSWRAQRRLHQRYKVLGARIGIPKATVAVAREFAGFIWAAGHLEEGSAA